MPQRRKVILKHSAATTHLALIPQNADDKCVRPLVWYDHPCLTDRARIIVVGWRGRSIRGRSQICIADLCEVFPRRVTLETRMKQVTPALQTERVDILGPVALYFRDDTSRRRSASSL